MDNKQALEIIIGAKTDPRYQSALSQVRRDLKSIHQDTNTLGQAFGDLAKPVAAAFAGFSAVTILKDAARAATEYQTEMLKLDAVVRATGGAAGFTAQQLDQMARAEDLATLGGAQNIRAAMSELLTFKSVQGEVFERAISAASDLSAVFGQDMTGSAVQLGKALEDPIKGISALSRVGVTFTEDQQGVIKSLVETGDVAKAQGIILEAIEGQVGGASEAMATGMAGALDTLSFHWTELLQNIGAATNENLAPAVNLLSGAISATNDNLHVLSAVTQDVIDNALNPFQAFFFEMYVSVERSGVLIEQAWDETLTGVQKRIASASGALGNFIGLFGGIEQQIKLNALKQEMSAFSRTTGDYSGRLAALDLIQKEYYVGLQQRTTAEVEAKLASGGETQALIATSGALETLGGKLPPVIAGTGKLSDEAKKLKSAQDSLTDSLKEQIATFGMDSEEKRRWKAESDGLMTAENAALLDKLEYLEFEQQQRHDIADLRREMFEEEKRETQELWELDKQRAEDWERAQKASRGFESAILGGLSSGGLSGAANSLINFMGGDSAKDFSFAGLAGDYGFGDFGGSVDKFVAGIGGMQNAASYLGGVMSLTSGTSRGAMEGIGSLAGTYFGGPLGASVGKFIGGSLSDMGFGGSTPYQGKGFEITGSLDNAVLAALASNNKNDNRDILNRAAGTFGTQSWDINTVLAGDKSLGQDQLKFLLQIDDQLKAFDAQLEQTVAGVGKLFGQDVLARFEAEFDDSINISGNENFAEKFAQWMQQTGERALSFVGDLVAEGDLDNFQQIILDVGTATQFNVEAMAQAAYGVDSLRMTMQFLQLDAGLITGSLLDMSGGMQTLQSQLDFYYQQFVPEAERQSRQLEAATQELNLAFMEMGVIVPQTRAEFRAFIEGITDDAKLATALAVADAADMVFDEQEKALDAQVSNIERQFPVVVNSYERQAAAVSSYAQTADRAMDEIQRGAESLLDYLKGSMFGDDSTLSTQEKLTRAESAFLSALQGGDAGAQVDAAKIYQDIAKQAYGDSANYAAVDRMIRGSLAGEASRTLGVAPVQAALGGSLAIQQKDSAELAKRLASLEKMLEEQRMTNRLLVENIRAGNTNAAAIVDSNKAKTPVAKVAYA